MISVIFFTEIAGSLFQLISGGTRRQKQGLTNKGAVWIIRSMGCVPSLWRPLHREMQDQVCLASLHSDYSSCRQAVCIKSHVSVSLEINWYVTPRRLS